MINPLRKLILWIAIFNVINLFSQDQNAQIRVMTFNIRFDNPADGINSWTNRKELLTKTLDSQSPDFIGMQEVLMSQMDYLQENLPGYRSVGVGREDGMTMGEYSPVFYKYERFSLLANGTFWLSANPGDTGSVGWDAALTRICTWGKFLDKSSGQEFYFLNTHFDHMGKTARTESARLILDFIKKETNGMEIILTGDFNSSPGEEPHSVLTNPAGGLTDVCPYSASGNCSEGTFNGFGTENDPLRIDMIYCRDKWAVESYKVLKIKEGEMYLSDHWPVMATLKSQHSAQTGLGDTTIIQTFTYDSVITRRAVFQFPEKGKRYRKILMYYTLKCDSLTPHDKYPCGEWDYTTYTRVFHPAGKLDSVKYTQPSFVVKGKSPKIYLYSAAPTYTYYESYPEAWSSARNASMVGAETDRFARFDGADYIEVQGEAFGDVTDEITVSFWLYGDPFHQPNASTIFEGLDAEGKRVVNLHVPYDNGVVYWDAGGHGEGLTDNIYRAADPLDYKGRWTHWAVTKNSITGEQRIYLNGELFQKGTGLKRSLDGMSTFRIGSNGKGNGKFYRGSLDDFAAWGRELDSTEIKSLVHTPLHQLSNEKLLFAYNFNDASALPIIPDVSGKGRNGKGFGFPSYPDFNRLPNAGFKPQDNDTLQKDSIMNAMVSVVMYGDSLNPGKSTDTLAVWPGYHYHCNNQGIVIDSAVAGNAKELQRKTRTWFGEPFEVVEQFEIGRFITPYGKRLDLGLDGFTWVYDVTDYEPLLHGQVDLQAANGQELLDLRFLFIEGAPPRDVMSVRNIWPEGSYIYKDLADDKVLQSANMQLDENASSFLLRARISGHGHNGPNNCCEWDPKMHTYTVNGGKDFNWKVWRDCGMNPVYPQGGTWQFDRAGWCPGTFVDTYDFEITPYVKPGSGVSIDYSIQPYDPDNGEEGGNYEMAMHLFGYSAPNYRLDLEMNDILAPSNRQEYRRMNPLSLNPVIRVRNTGSDTILDFTVVYGLKGGSCERFEWSGKLGFMQSADIILPKPSWNGLTENSLFEAMIEKVNGRQDELTANNRLLSAVEEPVILPGRFYIHVKTQGFGRAADNAYQITDKEGKIVSERKAYEDNSTYDDVVRLKPGAYDFTFTDKNEDGMIRHWWLYWEDPDKVGENGELKILDMEKKEIMNLGYDFAEKRTLQFFIGSPE